MTISPLDRLHTDLGALAVAWAGAQPAFGAVGAGEESFGVLSGSGLVRVVEEAAGLRRSLDAFLARAGDEVAARSAPELGAESLAKQHGHASPAKLVAVATGGSPGEASRLLAVGAATRGRESFTGEVLPAKFEHVRVGLDAGSVSVEAASLITGMLTRVEVRADRGLLGPYEQKLVELAAGQPLSLVARAVKLAEARLDADGLGPADERMHAERSLVCREDSDGVFHLRARLDPLTAAPIKAVLDALVSDALRQRGSGGSINDATANGAATSGAAATPGVPATTATTAAAAAAGGGGGGVGGLGAVIADRRSIPQLQADALAELARHALGCQAAPGSAPTATIVVRMSIDALRDGLGIAEIDGIDRPIAAGTVRKLAADAELIPAVLGGDSVPLDLGRSARLFSRSQRLALMERDGGCASCSANLTFAHAHHVDWWSRGGPTDLTNGVMLCSACHHQIHDHGWDIRITGDDRRGQVWFIPPPHLDPDQTPRLGGKARYTPNPEPPPTPTTTPTPNPNPIPIPAGPDPGVREP
jgi:Domain of unknown function (DUF222)/HNH endonuclease